MHIRIDSSKRAALYTGSDCGYCGNPLPEQGVCVCGIWRVSKITQPVYIVEITKESEALIAERAAKGISYTSFRLPKKED